MSITEQEVEAIETLLRQLEERIAHGEETFIICRMCDEAEGHKDNCAVPIVRNWLKKSPGFSVGDLAVYHLDPKGWGVVEILKVHDDGYRAKSRSTPSWGIGFFYPHWLRPATKEEAAPFQKRKTIFLVIDSRYSSIIGGFSQHHLAWEFKGRLDKDNNESSWATSPLVVTEVELDKEDF